MSSTLVAVERRLAAALVRLGGPVRVHPFHGFGADGRVRLGGRVLVGAPPRPRTSAPRATDGTPRGRWAVVRANLLPFLTLEVPRARVRLQLGDRIAVVRADGGGYLRAELEDVALTAGRHTATLTPEEPSGRSSTVVVHVLDPATDVAVVSDIDDTIVDSGVAHGLRATLATALVREQSTRVPLEGAPELYRALARGGEHHRPFFYLSTSPWDLAGFLQGFLVRHGFPDGPLLLMDWGPSTTGAPRLSRSEHKLAALRDLARQLPRVRFVLIGDTGQQDPSVYAAFAREHPGRVACVYVRRAGDPGAQADARADRAAAVLADCGVPFLVTGDSAEMLRHARTLGLADAQQQG